MINREHACENRNDDPRFSGCFKDALGESPAARTETAADPDPRRRRSPLCRTIAVTYRKRPSLSRVAGLLVYFFIFISIPSVSVSLRVILSLLLLVFFFLISSSCCTHFSYLYTRIAN